jgi:hypothetical protein
MSSGLCHKSVLSTFYSSLHVNAFTIVNNDHLKNLELEREEKNPI